MATTALHLHSRSMPEPERADASVPVVPEAANVVILVNEESILENPSVQSLPDPDVAALVSVSDTSFPPASSAVSLSVESSVITSKRANDEDTSDQPKKRAIATRLCDLHN